MSQQTRADTRREWRLTHEALVVNDATFNGPAIHVREVFPGDIAISREELMACYKRNSPTSGYVLDGMINDLFGPLPEGSLRPETEERHK